MLHLLTSECAIAVCYYRACEYARAANIVLLLVLMCLLKILILKYSKIPRSLLNTTTTLIYTQHTLYILSYNKTLLSGRKVHAYLALFLAISSSSLVSSTLLLHSVSLQVLLEMLELCNQVSTHGIHLGTRVLDCAHAQPLKNLKFGGKSEF